MGRALEEEELTVTQTGSPLLSMMAKPSSFLGTTPPWCAVQTDSKEKKMRSLTRTKQGAEAEADELRHGPERTDKDVVAIKRVNVFACELQLRHGYAAIGRICWLNSKSGSPP